MIIGKFLDTSLSKPLIKPFIRKNSIDVNEYINYPFKSFNDCFSRVIKPEFRPVNHSPNILISPADGLLSVYKISDGTVMPIKQSKYTVESLLKSKSLAEKYNDGIAVVVRLCVHNYHRYCYIDSGTKSDNFHINGVLHTVRPIALQHLPVFTENSREYTLMETENFGTVTQIEIGAMLVGKIKNHHREYTFQRGEEKGTFLYGGSTVVLLFEKNSISIDDNLISSDEIPVMMGQRIGVKSV